MTKQNTSCCGGTVQADPSSCNEIAPAADCCTNSDNTADCCKEETQSTTDTGKAYRTVPGELTKADIKVRRKLRWGIGRNNSVVSPGLYAVGSPDGGSPVLVSANYRMSFDYLRSSMPERSFWILVLDTKGINVWCAAGKGTFGTEEIVRQVKAADLSNTVSHKNITLPQLGAPGVEAHTVRKETGFKVIYGPVRAEDIGKFIDNGNRADEEMRKVHFPIRDRLILTPVELVQSWKLLIAVLPYLFLFHLLQNRGLNSHVIVEGLLYLGSIIAGAIVTPLVLPWAPGRSLALKGWIIGIIMTAATVFFVTLNPITIAAYFILLPAISSFISMNFTGSTTYTSFSGVIKEMTLAVPLQITAVVAGTALQIIKIFV